MKLFNAELTREADNYTIKHEPISSIDLMERAAASAAEKILQLYPESESFVIFAGPGNNGGDGLVIGRLLADKGFNVNLQIVKFTKNESKDFSINKDRIIEQGIADINILEKEEDFPPVNSEQIIIDALFGSGLTRKLNGLPELVVKLINRSGAETVSIDSPSGLFGEENSNNQNSNEENTVIKAKHTLTFQYPSLSFLFPENEEYVGDFHIIDIGIHPDYIKNTNSDFYYFENKDFVLTKRKKFSHKGNFGHALLMAGSYGKAGASVLAVKAAHRSGAGLVTAHVSSKTADIMHICSPDTMLYIDSGEDYISDKIDLNFCNAIGIGPGIGFKTGTKELLFHIIMNFNKPIVFDADAITILSENSHMLKNVPAKSIFTPHPKEFKRLFGKYDNSYMRIRAQVKYAKKYNIIIVLKGAYCSIAVPEGKVYFNSTGNPGMATGGSGDVLTGIITSLLAQGFEPEEAAKKGVYIHGLAGDFAAKKYSQIAMTASDIIENLPDAFKTFEPKLSQQ